MTEDGVNAKEHCDVISTIANHGMRSDVNFIDINSHFITMDPQDAVFQERNKSPSVCHMVSSIFKLYAEVTHND